MTVFGYALADWLTVASAAAAAVLALVAGRYRRLYLAASQRAAVYAAGLVTVKPRTDEEAQLAELGRELLTTRAQLASARSVHAQHMRRCIGLRNTPRHPTTSG
jgi:RecB family exonuclease